MEIVNVNYLGSKPEFQEYTDKDLSLVNFNIISRNFGAESDYIEYFIYDLNNNLLTSNYNVNSYSIKGVDPINNENNVILLNPDQDVKNEGFDRGAVNITYNIFRKLFNSSNVNKFWIGEISTDRTELRVYRQDLSNDELQLLFNEYNVEVSSKNYYQDFYLNFGDNITLIGVNLLYALSNEQASLLIKLYEPLPDNFSEKDSFWLVDKLSEPATYNIDIQIPAEEIITRNNLQGPNFNIDISERVGQSTNYLSLGSIFNNSISSSYRQLKSLVDEKGYDINVDYSDFNNFIHFSSAVERITNFAYKVQLIEKYNEDIKYLNIISGNTDTVSSSISVVENKINDVIEKFDGYEYYLYFSSESSAWPKSNSSKPYNLYSYTSSQAIEWLGGINTIPTTSGQSILYSASVYDLNNKDWLLNTVPAYLKEDPNNEPYQIFLSMIGQHFDNIWIYINDITNRYNANNSLDKGISRDEVADALKSLGIKLYTNTNISDNIFYSLIGTGPQGETLPPTGSEVITTYVTSSVETMPADDITNEYYKRIYHNLPYLLKNKGTNIGLRALINCFGIPDTLLKINEFGGSDKLASTPDLIQDNQITSYWNSGSEYIRTPWGPSQYQLISSSFGYVVPDTIEFNFKNIEGTPTDSKYYSQSLFQVGQGDNLQFGVNLVYNPSSSILDSPNEKYGTVRLYMNGSYGFVSSSEITLPFFDPSLWWTLSLKREIGGVNGSNYTIDNTYTLYVKSSLYNFNGGTNIGFEGSASINITTPESSSYNESWTTYNTSSIDNLFIGYLGGYSSSGILSEDGVNYQGLISNFKYWAEPLSSSVISEHTQNLNSYRGNDLTSSLYTLIFNLPLDYNKNIPTQGQSITKYESYDGSLIRQYFVSKSFANSYHPAISGTFLIPSINQYYTNIGSISSGSETVSYGIFEPSGVKKFAIEQRYDLIATPSTGLSQKVNNKINTPIVNELSSSILSKDVSIQILNDEISKNTTDLEVGFSPSDVIDNDITNQLGYFNIDDYIGSPSDQYENSYSSLDNLRKIYFQKYQNSFKIWDFVRLIKYYDNSLFKMIKDFVPAKANLSTGIIVKPHILDRSKYKRNEPLLERYEYSSSINTAFITGSDPQGIDINTNYVLYNTSSVGYIQQNIQDRSQTITGEFGGSKIDITNGEFIDYETSNIITPNSAYFVTYSINPLISNISSSRKSSTILDIDYSTNPNIPVNNQLITQALDEYSTRLETNNPLITDKYWPFAEIEDSNYSSYYFKTSRYEGSRIFSQDYNTYQGPTTNYVGDSSYGKTAAVDHYVKKIALFTEVESSSFFPNRNNASITHLIDEEGNYTQLDGNLSHWEELQNTFKDDFATINLFDPKQYGDQKFTNGQKPVYNSGYSYEPIFYFTNTGSSKDISASFDYTGESFAQAFNILPSSKTILPLSGTQPDAFYYTTSGSLSPTWYTASIIFSPSGRDQEYNDGVFFSPKIINSNLTLPSFFKAKTSNTFIIDNKFSLFANFSNRTVSTLQAKYSIVKETPLGQTEILSVTKSFNSNDSLTTANQAVLNVPGYTYTVTQNTNISSIFITPGEVLKITDQFGNIIQNTTAGIGGINLPAYEVRYTSISPRSGRFNPRFTDYPESILPVVNDDDGLYLRQSYTITVYKYADTFITNVRKGSSVFTGVLEFDNTIVEYLNVGETLSFNLYINGLDNPNLTLRLLDEGYIKNTVQGGTPLSEYPFLDFNTENNNVILKTSIAPYYGGSFKFLPSGSGFTSSSLYSVYGDVNYNFNLERGDIILLFQGNNKISSEHVVVSTFNLGDEVRINVSPSLPSSISSSLQSTVFLKKIKNENNIILNFKKNPGKTSYGLLIPNNIDPVVMQNIDLIKKEIQTKLLNTNINF